MNGNTNCKNDAPRFKHRVNNPPRDIIIGYMLLRVSTAITWHVCRVYIEERFDGAIVEFKEAVGGSIGGLLHHYFSACFGVRGHCYYTNERYPILPFSTIWGC